jgi:hypothetical protein
VVKKEEILFHQIKSEFKNRILFINVNQIVFKFVYCQQDHEDPEIQAELDKGKIVNILYDSSR